MSDPSRIAGRFALLLLLAGLAGLLAGTRLQLDVHQVAAGGSAQVDPVGESRWWPQQPVRIPVAEGERRVLLRLPALLPARLAYYASDQPGPVEVRSVAVRVLGLPLGGALSFEPPVVLDQMASGGFELEFVLPPAQAATSTLVHVPWWLRAWMLLPAALLAAACWLVHAARGSPARGRGPGEGSCQTWLALLFLAACYGVMVYQAVWLGPWLPMWDDWRYLVPGPFSFLENHNHWLGMAGNDTYFLTGQLLDWLALRASGGSFLAIRLFALALLGLFLVFAAHLALHLPRYQSLLALVALAFVLGADGYWTLQAIAYHQFLPVLFLMIAIAVLQRAWQYPERQGAGVALALAACALLAGLAYISGAMLFLAFAIGTAAGLGGRLRRVGVSRSLLPVLILLAVALATTLLQVWMVTQVQGSLLERTHASPTVLPDDWRFWVFQLGLVARTFQLRASLPTLEVVLYLLVLAAGLVLLVRAWRTEGADRFLAAIGVGLIAAALVYACVVAAGRAGIAEPDATWAKVVEMASARFHFWWLAALLPVPLAMAAGRLPGFQRWARIAVPVVACALVLVKVVSVVRIDQTGYRRTGQQEAQGIACIRARYDLPNPLLCEDLYPVDLRAPVEAARQHDLRLWRSLMQVP